MQKTEVARAVFSAWSRGFEGTMTLAREGFRARLGIRGDKIVYVEGVPGLLAGVLPDGATGDLTQDVGLAIARGVMPEDALRAASVALGRYLVRAEGFEVAADDIPPPRGGFPLPLTILRMLTLGFEAERDPEQIAEALGSLRDFTCSPRRRRPVPGLDPVAVRMLHAARRAPTLGELVDGMITDPSRADRVWIAADMLLQLGVLELRRAGRRSRPPARSTRSSPPAAPAGAGAEVEAPVEPRAAPPSAPPDVASGAEADELAASLRQQAEDWTGANPLRVLGIDPVRATDVTHERIREAFRQKATSCHPDRYVDASPAVHEAATAAFNALLKASAMLRDPEILKESFGRLEAERAGHAYVAEIDVTRARVFFRKAEALTRSRRWAEAGSLAQQAVDTDPNPGAYRALLIVCEALTGQRSPRRALAELDQLELKRPSEQAKKEYNAGLILKQADQVEGAMARFRRALSLDPELRDAEREIRLHERRTGGRGGDRSSSRFSGLFQRRDES